MKSDVPRTHDTHENVRTIPNGAASGKFSVVARFAQSGPKQSNRMNGAALRELGGLVWPDRRLSGREAPCQTTGHCQRQSWGQSLREVFVHSRARRIPRLRDTMLALEGPPILLKQRHSSHQIGQRGIGRDRAYHLSLLGSVRLLRPKGLAKTRQTALLPF